MKNYVAFTVFGNNYFIFRKRSAQKSLLRFRISDDHVAEVSQLLDDQNISFVQKRSRFKITSVPVSICAAIVGHQLGELGAHAVYQHPTPENIQKAMAKFTEWFDGEISAQNKFHDSLTKPTFSATLPL